MLLDGVFKPCIKVPRGIRCQGTCKRANGIIQGKRGDSVEKHFIGFYRMHLIKSLSGLLNQRAWRATRRLAHWAEYLKLNFCSYSPKACVSFLSTLDCSGESWFSDLASPDNCVTSRMRKSPQYWVYIPSTRCTFLLTQLDRSGELWPIF